jgi:hypothetical protein
MIQAVITYKNNGARSHCGQTVGADGRGEYAVLVEADTPEAGDEKAREYVKKLISFAQYPTHITNIVVVVGHETETFSGNNIQTI